MRWNPDSRACHSSLPKMKHLASSVLILLALICGVCAQTAPDASELTKLLQDFLAGAGRNDLAIHERFWADDLIYTSSTGRRIGKADILREVREEGPPKSGDDVTVYTARRYSHSAIRRHRCRRFPSCRHDGQKREQDSYELPEHRHLPETRQQMAGSGLASYGDAQKRRTAEVLVTGNISGFAPKDR